MCQSQQHATGHRNIRKCSKLCADLFTDDSEWSSTSGGAPLLIIVDIIDDMLSHDRAKAIKANLMPNSLEFPLKFQQKL